MGCPFADLAVVLGQVLRAVAWHPLAEERLWLATGLPVEALDRAGGQSDVELSPYKHVGN